METKTSSGKTVLHLAAEKGYLALVQWLVEVASVDINGCDVNDFQPQRSCSEGAILAYCEILPIDTGDKGGKVPISHTTYPYHGSSV